MLYILLLLIGILVVCTNGYSIGRISRSSIVRSRTRLYQTFQEYLKNNGSSGSSSSSSSSSSSKTSISDADFEDLLMSGDNAVPTVVDEPPPTTTTEKGSGVQELFTIATTILAKTKVTDLRALISKYDSTKLPDINADSETHISMALDTVWALKGDWDELIVLLNQELGEKAKIGEEFMNKAVVIGSTLTLDKIKELIVKYKDKSALPRINKEKYVGKLLKGDYLATLIDIIREECMNDYEKVHSIMIMETSKGGVKAEKRGFGAKK